MGRHKKHDGEEMISQSFFIPISARQILQTNADYAGISMSALITKLIMAHDKLIKHDLNN